MTTVSGHPSPREALLRTAAKAHEMHRLYPFTRTVSGHPSPVDARPPCRDDEPEDEMPDSICTCGWPDYSDCQGGGFPCPANPEGRP